MSLVLDLIFPRRCYGCGQISQYLCPSCRHHLTFKSIKHKSRSRLEGRLCLFRYHGAIKQLITDLKFNYVTDLVPELVGFIGTGIITKYPNLLKYWQESQFILTPIPLHPSRQNWRGFNQAELIGRQLSSILKISYRSDILIRTNNNPPQAKIHNKIHRRANIHNSFALTSQPIPQNIILFDDVYTTGSTLSSSASIFPKNTNLWGLTIAG